ncbi:putative sinapoylglucose--choline O-sinapoyltransferase [Helianthus annuus]|nr:putative sinapoylglucose--choline O-sinapoyltransferase [Helianthus annuus]
MISSDTLSASQTATFLRKFVRDHPKFLNNTIYVAGISYSGIVVPMVTEEIYKGNDAGLKPILNIKGYLEGNPLTDKTEDVNSRVEFAYRMALISYELFEVTFIYYEIQHDVHYSRLFMVQFLDQTMSQTPKKLTDITHWVYRAFKTSNIYLSWVG